MSEFQQASMSIKVPNFNADAPMCVYQPNWFARVVLRRKPRYSTWNKIMAQTADDMNYQMGLHSAIYGGDR